jgi:hypothetical protein
MSRTPEAFGIGLQRRLDAIKSAFDVRIPVDRKFVERQSIDCSHVQASTSVEDEHRRHNLLHDAIHECCVARVTGDYSRAEPGDRFELHLIAGYGRHIGAAGEERFNHGAAEAGTAAGDEDAFCLDLGHGRAPSFGPVNGCGCRQHRRRWSRTRRVLRGEGNRRPCAARSASLPHRPASATASR